jgi:beta-lactamase superfamily II metal-dependent hydrolase
LSSITLLDVGHGNCAIVQDGEKTAVIDCPTGTLLLDTLENMEIETISVAIVSHADKDHIAGILSLLTSDRVRVERIYINPDSQRRTKIWEAFRIAAQVTEKKGSCEIVTSLSSTTPGVIVLGSITITVVSPSVELALAGVGGLTLEDQPISANTLSAVLRIEKDPGDGVLLAGDMDQVSLDNALKLSKNMSARVLVYPHHGGLPGAGDASAFVSQLLNAVQPKSVVFSNGRGRHNNPRPEIVASVRQSGCSIACTQLSKRCQPQAVDATAYLEPIRALGKTVGACCAGSITLMLDGGAARLASG